MEKNGRFEFRVELIPPIDPNGIHRYFEELKCLLKHTNKFSLASHPVAGTIAGFDRGYNLAKFLLAKVEKVDILFHITCKDLNRVNVESRLTLLRNLGVKRLLLVTGERYSTPERFKRLHFINSTELAQHISENFGTWFETIAVAGYPGVNENGWLEAAFNGNQRGASENKQQMLASPKDCNICSHDDATINCDRVDDSLYSLGKKICIPKVSSIYTQCVFDANTFKRFTDKIEKSKFGHQLNEIVPSVAVFKDQASIERVARLTRVSSRIVTNAPAVGQITMSPTGIEQLRTIEQISDCKEIHDHSIQFIVGLCKDLRALRGRDLMINICAFNLFDTTFDIMDKLKMEKSTLEH